MRILRIAVLSLLALGFLHCGVISKTVSAKNGELELTESDLFEGKPIALQGEWSFYPQNFSKNLDPNNRINLKVPGLWNQYPIQSRIQDGQGYGTYVLDLKLPDAPRQYSIYIPEVRTSFEATIGSRSIRSGKPGNSKETSIPSSQGQSFSFVAGKSVKIVIEVSNFFHKEGGLGIAPIFGKAEDVQNLILARGTIDLAFTGAIFMFGIYHFILFFFRHKQREAFFFGFFCLVFAVRILFTSSKTIYAFSESIPWSLVVYLDYATVFVLAILFLWFAEGLFPKFISLNNLQLMTAFVQFVLIFGLIVPPIYFTRYETVFQIIGLVYSVFLLFRLVQLYLKKIPESGLFLMGSMLLILGFVTDILFAFGGMNESYLSQIALFLFFGAQSSIVTLRNAKTFNKRKELKNDFEEVNERFILTNRFFGKFIPRDFLNHLGKESIEEVKLGDSSEREMTVMFADIWEYWDIIYGIPLENRILFTNSYLGRIGPYIRSNNGFIDKYIGSAIMALFDGGIHHGIKSAVDIQWELELYNTHRRNYGYAPLHVGIGIHSGDTMLGILGEKERMESTVISDTVNLASRIQGLTKKYQSRILVSLTSLMLHEDLDTILYRILDFVRVKGKQETVMIAEVMIPGIDQISDKKIEFKDLFESAIFDYERADFVSALSGFESVKIQNPDDLAANIYIERCKYFMSAGVDEDWDGVAAWEK